MSDERTAMEWARATGVSSVRITRAAHRLGVGRDARVLVPAYRKALVLTPEEWQHVAEDIESRARARLEKDLGIVAAIEAARGK